MSPNRIAEQRKAKRMTQHDLAEALGVHWVTISKLERGKMKLTMEWITKISGALKVAPIELMPENNTFPISAVEQLAETKKQFEAIGRQLHGTRSNWAMLRQTRKMSKRNRR
jgi:transcriptional regulator with XRE-family HTH domain